MKRSISRRDAILLIAQARQAVCAPEVLRELLESYGVNTVFDALLEVYAGVNSGFLSQVCEAISGQKLLVVGEPDARIPCPCCGRRTLGELFDAAAGTGYDVCDYCGWEDDGTSNAQEHSGVNRGSMEEYREKVRREYLCGCDKWPV